MVSSRDVKQRGPVEIDKRFPIPLGLIDATQKQDGSIPVEFGLDGPPPDDGTGTAAKVDIGGNTQPDPQPTYAYQPPANITIVSQTVRILPDGSHVVDVLIDVTDVPGITEYEVRTTKTA